MRASSPIAALFVGLCLACGWGGGDDPMPSVPLTPPWDAMALPVGEARVTHADADTISARHSSEDVIALGKRYAEALDAAGWSLERDESVGSIVQQTWSRGDDELSMSVLRQRNESVVSLTVIPF